MLVLSASDVERLLAFDRLVDAVATAMAEPSRSDTTRPAGRVDAATVTEALLGVESRSAALAEASNCSQRPGSTPNSESW